MKIYSITETSQTDITELVTTVKWSGELSQVARRVDFGIISSPSDKYIPVVNIPLGSVIKVFKDDGDMIFKGFVFLREKSYSGDVMNVTAYDNLIYWTKSKSVIKVKNITPEAFAAKLCSETGTSPGTFAKTGVQFTRIFKGSTYYEMIQTAYTEAHKKNGKEYMPRMNDGKLDVIEIGSKVVSTLLTNFNPDTKEGNLMDSNFTESIENMVNRVIITDDKGKKIGTVEDANLIRLYGVIQDVYQKEDKKNPTPIAKSLLKGVEQTASVSAIGNEEFITGMAVNVKDEYTGLVGRFYIISDEHVWENGTYTMTLNLSLESIMDEQSAGDVK